ncbi:chloramphenicol acetyltransferase CAT [Sporanaerobium hydrogeniformans]|uniref:Chloramphenicol acetyltransferase CAT n=1 Tax=Sporanaerobium hydrogeniformans TaxID=3072179 RepID=A0AC61D786_9FIRM|nr:CatA-like O-acetyltransferase [Sporanaerobium hydrogeniformans]PHV69484.1 chloramphenicol acetyltransferase CAT [Sporanaerobium hydrogeniformans]
MELEFCEINLKEWKRAPYFEFYTKMLPTGFNLCVELDVTKMYTYFKEKGYKFAIGYRYITMKLINERAYFRVAYKEGKLGYYNYLTPTYANFHSDDATTTIMWVEYRETFEAFQQHYLEEENKYKGVHGIVAKPTMPPENSCMVGVLPWTSFISYSPIPYSAPTTFFPVLQAGKLKRVGEKIWMPFSITISHAVVDGYQVSEYLEQLQLAMNLPEKICSY